MKNTFIAFSKMDIFVGLNGWKQSLSDVFLWLLHREY
jgi:hypothetical protein